MILLYSSRTRFAAVPKRIPAGSDDLDKLTAMVYKKMGPPQVVLYSAGTQKDPAWADLKGPLSRGAGNLPC